MIEILAAAMGPHVARIYANQRNRSLRSIRVDSQIAPGDDASSTPVVRPSAESNQSTISPPVGVLHRALDEIDEIVENNLFAL
jgi:hypothetical protein